MAPAVLSGAALAFARAIGEFGSVILISGNLIGKTEVSSAYILKLIESDDPVARLRASPRSCSLVAVVVLVVLDVLQRSAARRG